MAITVFKASAETNEGLTTICRSRGFEYTLDEPPELGGQDKGMNPVESLLASYAACKGIVVRAFAQKFRINLKSIKVELEGDLDPDGFMGLNKDAKIGFSEIRTRYLIEADNSDQEIDRFLKFVERNCPVGDTLQNPARMSYTVAGRETDLEKAV